MLINVFPRAGRGMVSFPGVALVPHLPRVIDVCPRQGQQASPDKEQHPSRRSTKFLKRSDSKPESRFSVLCFLLFAFHFCTGPNSPLVKGEYSGLPEGGGLVPANPNSNPHLPKTNILKQISKPIRLPDPQSVPCLLFTLGMKTNGERRKIVRVMKIIKEKSLFRTQGKISYFPRIGDLSFPSDDRFFLCSTFSRGRFSLFILYPGLRSFLTYPGLLMSAPVRGKNPRQIRINAPQMRSFKPSNAPTQSRIPGSLSFAFCSLPFTSAPAQILPLSRGSTPACRREGVLSLQ